MNVLIIDDDRDASDRLADFLAASGHTTWVAANGLEARREVETDPPDVILLNLETPLLENSEMAQALAAGHAGKAAIPIVLISASQHLARIADVVGTPYYLSKPFGISDAIRMVNEALQVSPR